MKMQTLLPGSGAMNFDAPEPILQNYYYQCYSTSVILKGHVSVSPFASARVVQLV